MTDLFNVIQFNYLKKFVLNSKVKEYTQEIADRIQNATQDSLLDKAQVHVELVKFNNKSLITVHFINKYNIGDCVYIYMIENNYFTVEKALNLKCNLMKALAIIQTHGKDRNKQIEELDKIDCLSGDYLMLRHHTKDKVDNLGYVKNERHKIISKVFEIFVSQK